MEHYDDEYNIHVTGYNNGGPRSYETFRIAWSVVKDARELDFRTREAQDLVRRGLAGYYYAKGAAERDADIWRARASAELAVERLR